MKTITNIAAEVNELHGELSGLARTSLEKAIRIGELLTEQKASLKHGEWLPWCRDNLKFGQNSVNRYMMVFGRQDEIPHNDEFGLTEAYRLLSQPAQDSDSEEDKSESPDPSPRYFHGDSDESRFKKDEEPAVPSTAAKVDEIITPRGTEEPEEDEPYVPNQAMNFATMAIAQLDRIDAKDARRKEAFEKVIRYCERKTRTNKKQ
jgi:hypothetical protein